MGVAEMKISKIMSALVLFQMISTTSLMAAPTAQITGGPYQNNYYGGGEFTSTIANNGGTSGFADGYQFQTFCLEKRRKTYPWLHI